MLNCQFNGALIGNRLRSGSTLDERKRPVVTVIRDSKENLFGRDFCDGIVQNGPDVGNGSNSERRAICISTMML